MRNIDVREIHWLVAPCSCPMGPGIEPAAKVQVCALDRNRAKVLKEPDV